MKHLFTAAAAAALVLAGPQAHCATVPGVDAWFDSIAISVAAGQQSQFVMGDNIAGYFEGYTQHQARGAGYIIKNEPVFAGYSTAAGMQRNERSSGSEQVLPYGHRVAYAGGVVEEMALLSKQQAIAITLSSRRRQALEVTPALRQTGAVTRDGDVVLVAPGAGQTLHAAMAADVPFTLGSRFALRTSAPSRKLTVAVAFAPTAGEAARRARELAGSDPVGRERRLLHAQLTKSYLATSDAGYNKALSWAKAASRMFVVEEFGTGIWAGLPWFRDNWGRDTFIALPGTLLVSGQFADARAVLANFARYQNLKRDKDYGRIPNRVAAGDSIIYNTVDGTPWMLREALEYIRYSGDRAFAREMYKLAVPYFEGAIASHMDSDGLLAHDSADTWMDARIDNRQPWSARGPRAVEIQALWYTALHTGAELATQAGDSAQAARWQQLAQRAQQSFLKLFWDGSTMADRLREDGSRDMRVRPNQLMLVSIPFDDFVPGAVQAKVVRNAVSDLLYPYGIASLSQDDPYFHPRHENPAFHHKDAAYHQGTVWGWNAGFTVTALNKFGYQDLAWTLTRNLGQQIMGLGTLGNMSELLDALPGADGKPRPSGTYAQSWSVAEYARNGYQDFVGFRPDLPANRLAFVPAIPAGWKWFDAVLPFGAGEHLAVAFKRRAAAQEWTLRLSGKAPRSIRFDFLNHDKSRSRAQFQLAPGKAVVLNLASGRAQLNGRPLELTASQPSHAAVMGELRFRQPAAYRPDNFPMLRAKDVLKGIMERNEYR